MPRKNNLPKLLFLQGPPQSGKDTCAKILQEVFNYNINRFAQPIIDAMQKQFFDFFTSERDMEKFKKFNFAPFFTFNEEVESITGRDIMIAWSETFMKPLFGSMIFGTLMRHRLNTQVGPFAFPDSGFPDEAQPLFLDTPRTDCAIIQLYRPGHSFTGDSRSYWSGPNLATYSFNNNFDTVEDLTAAFITFFDTHVYPFNGTIEAPHG